MPDSNSLLFVIDFQRAFLETKQFQCFSRYWYDLTSNINRAIQLFRDNNAKIVFTKMVYNYNILPETVIEHVKNRHFNEFLSPGAPSTELYQIKPDKEDIIIEKSTYDAFLEPCFESLFEKNKHKDLYVTGLYLDVCINFIVAGLYQRGVLTSVLSDCVATDFFKKEDMADYMKNYYNSNFRTLSSLGGC